MTDPSGKGDAMPIAVINPATGETEEKFAALSPADVEERLGRAARAAATYRWTSYEERGGWLRAAASVLPISVVIIVATSSRSRSSRSAAARSQPPRSS